MAVIHVHVGPRSEDNQYYVDHLVRAMGPEHVMPAAKLSQRVRERMSRPAGARTSAQAYKLMVRTGRRRFIEGDYAAALTSLERAREVALRHAGQFASDQGLRGAYYRALMFAGHAFLRSGKGDLATERIGEAIRSFPDKDLSLVQFGPELARFYRKVRREMSQRPRGSLEIDSGCEDCLVFVNERYVGLSPARVPDLYQGRYRVLVQRGQQQGRIHVVNVGAGPRELKVDFALDRALYSEPVVGLRFADPRRMRRIEQRLGAAVGQAAGAPRVALLGVREHDGRRVLRGAVISSDTARVVRAAMVALEPAVPSPDTLRQLARFLLSGTRARGLLVQQGGAAAAASQPAAGGSDAPRARSPYRWLKWTAAGAALLAIAGGVTLIALHGTGTCDGPPGVKCKEQLNILPGGVVLTSVGGALAVTSGG